MSQRYLTILADPPWMERGGGKIVRGANRHYNLMKTEDICRLPVWNFAAAESHLYLWVTNGFLPDGLKVMDSWGYRYVTCITWAKDRIGLGQYFRGQTEQLLFGVRRGSRPLPYKVDPTTGKRAQGTTLIEAPRTEHSAKPPQARTMIERVSYGPFLELFAREKTPGWDVWGNEVKSDIDLLAGAPPILGDQDGNTEGICVVPQSQPLLGDGRDLPPGRDGEGGEEQGS